jgi:hypothetical protein
MGSETLKIYDMAGGPYPARVALPDDDVRTNRVVGLTVNSFERPQMTIYRFFMSVASLLPLGWRLSK